MSVEVEEVLTMRSGGRPLFAEVDKGTVATDADQGGNVTLLDVCVADGENGPVLVLSGEADLSTLGQLNSALEELIWAGPRLLMVDLSRLRYADSASIAALVQADRTLRGQGGHLELLSPQRTVARVLTLTGVDQILTVRGAMEPESLSDGKPCQRQWSE